MKVTKRCFAIWDYLNRRRKYAYSQDEIRKGLHSNEELQPGLRNLSAKYVLSTLSVLKFNKLVRRINTPKGVYWRGQGNWPTELMKKHGGSYICYH